MKWEIWLDIYLLPFNTVSLFDIDFAKENTFINLNVLLHLLVSLLTHHLSYGQAVTFWSL